MKQNIFRLLFVLQLFYINNTYSQEVNCCNYILRQSKLDSIKKFKLFGVISETDVKSKNPNLIPYRKQGKWGYVSFDYKIKIPIKYDSAGIFWEHKDYGMIATVKSSNYTYYINTNGDSISGPSPKGTAPFKLRNMIAKSIYRTARGLDRANHFIESHGKYGFKTSRDTVVNCIYQNYGFLDGELFTVKNSKGWILIDTIGNVLTKEFDTIMHFSNRNFAIVKKNEMYGIINRKGKWIKKPKFKELNYSVFYARAIIYKKRKKYGLLDLYGKKLLASKYQLINQSTYFFNECFLFANKDGEYLYIDDFGNIYADR